MARAGCLPGARWRPTWRALETCLARPGGLPGASWGPAWRALDPGLEAQWHWTALRPARPRRGSGVGVASGTLASSILGADSCACRRRRKFQSLLAAQARMLLLLLLLLHGLLLLLPDSPSCRLPLLGPLLLPRPAFLLLLLQPSCFF